MNSLRKFANTYLSELITALVVLTISFLIINDGRLIFLFSATVICAVFALFALKFPTVPLYFLVIFGFVGEFLYQMYDFRWSGISILLTDPVYVIIFLTMVLSVIRDPGVVITYWNHLRGGVFLGFYFVILIVFGYQQNGYSALAEFRFQFIALFIPFYCLCARLTAEQWLRFLHRLFWIIAVLVVPLVAMSFIDGARPFSPGHRFLGAETHLWLMISVFLLFVPGLVRKDFGESVIAWLIGGGYVLLILSDAHRSVWLTAAAFLITILILGHDEFRTVRIMIALLCLTIVPLVVFIVFEGETSISDFIVSRTSAFFAPSADPTAGWRMQVWGAAWQIIKANPVMGIGLGQYSEDVWLVMGSPREGASLHNFYVTLLLKGGVVLTVLYGWYVLSMGWAFVKLRKDVSSHSHRFFVLGLASLVGMLAFQVAYGVPDEFMLVIGGLLALLMAGNQVNGKGFQS